MMKELKEIYALAYIETIERAKFYSRFEGLNVIFLTSNVSVYLYLKTKKAIVYFIKRKNINKIENEIKFLISTGLDNSLDVKLKNISYAEAQIAYKLIYQKLTYLHQKYIFNYFFIWNGCKLGDFACKDFAYKHNISTLYFEIANIPGKIFIDNQGTNKNSSIYSNPEKLDYISLVNKEKYEIWKKEYIEIKKNKFVLPQSKHVIKIKSLLSAILNIFSIILGISIKNKVYYYNLKALFKLKTKIINSTAIDIYKEKYVFVPLQVSNDTQIIINSDVSLKYLIDYAYEYAKYSSIKVVIKPHPAERNDNILRYVNLLKEKNNNIIVSNDNTMKLIENSELVITINSTVGLEAMIVGKKIKFLGYSFYSKFNNNRLINYIMSFLKNVDYFGKEKISEKVIYKLLENTER